MRLEVRILGRVARSRSLLRVTAAYAFFALTEYAVWIGVLVYAYDHGGATAAGLVALAQLVPSVLIAPLVATLADRYAPGRVITAGYGMQAVATGALAVAVAASASAVAYAIAVVASTAVSAIRPAQAVLVPALTRDVEELTATNVLVGWLESLSIVVAGLGTGLILTAGSVAVLFAGAALLLGVACGLVFPLKVRISGVEEAPGNAFRQVGRGIREVTRSRPTRVLVGLLGAEYVFIGALDVLFVVVAVDLLHRGQAWTGFLNTAYGAGGVLLGTLSALMVGRRLGPVICLSALMLGVTLGGTAVSRGPVAVVVLLGFVGGGRSLFDVATRALLQRAVPAHMVARVFGLAEALSMAGLALGSILTPLLVALGGARSALAGVAAVLPAMVIVLARLILRLDGDANVPIVEIALLRAIPLFRDMPGPALEGVARALERLDVAAGTVIIKQGDVGELYFAVAAGEVEIWRDGKRVRGLGRGDGIGEIALLRSVARTATVVTATAATFYTLDRAAFLTAVNGHVPTLAAAMGIARELDADDMRRDEDPRTS